MADTFLSKFTVHIRTQTLLGISILNKSRKEFIHYIECIY